MKRRLHKKKKRIHFGALFLSLLVIMGTGAAVAAVSYASGGFKAKNLEEKIKVLAEENRELETKASRLKSLQTLQEVISSQTNLVPVDNINYLQFSKAPNDESVSKK